MDSAQYLKANPAKAAYHLKQLRKFFSRASDQQFLQMVWAIGALRSGQTEAAARFLAFPPQAADQSPASRFAIHQWELETLLIQLFLTPKNDPQLGTASYRQILVTAGPVRRRRLWADSQRV
jgi:hypothetical protein